MLRIALLLIGPLLFCSASAQVVLKPRFEQRSELEAQLKDLLTQQQQILPLAPFPLTELPQTAQQVLLRAMERLDHNETALAAAMQQIEKYRDLSRVDRTEVLRREQAYLAIRRKIGSLQHLLEWLDAPLLFDPSTAQELRFYRLGTGMRIAETGAGDPAFARQLLAQLSPGVYFLNDIDSNQVQLISDFFHLSSPPSPIIPVLGESHSTRLEGQNLDAVIIRNALHHFEALPAMLAAIQQSLAPGGRLLIKETFIESCYGLCCPQLRSEAELLQALQEAGFVVCRRSAIHADSTTWHLLELQHTSADVDDNP